MHQRSGSISSKLAKHLISEERFELVKETEPIDGLYFSDIKEAMHLYWKPKRLSRKFISRAETVRRLEIATGYIRNQWQHPLCWAYTTGDVVSASLYLHGWEKEYVPLCAHFLCEEVDVESYRKNVPEDADLESDKIHSCYGCDVGEGLSYVENFGIPREREARFNCNYPRLLDPEEKMYKITDVFKYETLEQALVRLKSHPVAATLVLFDDWYEPEIYRGPLKQGAGFVGLHQVLMIECREIEGEMVIRCKSSNAKNTGIEGYIYVSVEVMLLEVGREDRKNEIKWCPKKPQYLLQEFYSVGMETGPLGLQFKEKPNRVQENLKFKVGGF